MTSRAAGFTLIELIAVLVIIGLLMAFTPMALDTLVSERELEREVTELGGTIENLRLQAVLDRADYAIHYDTEEHRWATQFPVEVTQPASREGEEPVTGLVLEEITDPSLLDWHDMPKGITMEMYEGNRLISKGRYRITFSPRGTVDPHILVLESNNISSLDPEDRARTLKVNFPGFVSYASGRRVGSTKLTESELGR